MKKKYVSSVKYFGNTKFGTGAEIVDYGVTKHAVVLIPLTNLSIIIVSANRGLSNAFNLYVISVVRIWHLNFKTCVP